MAKKNDFDMIYEEYANDLFRFCMFKIRNKESAQDIVSEAFVKYLQMDPADVDNPRAWLYRVCRNQIYDLVIKTKKRMIIFL